MAEWHRAFRDTVVDAVSRIPCDMNNEMVIQLLQNMVHEKEKNIKALDRQKSLRKDEKSMVASKYRLEQLALARAISALKHQKED